MNLFYKIVEKIYLSLPNNLVYYDSLTGIYSRMYYDRVVKKKYLSKECIVCYFDIDNLKKYNDTYGHSEGSKYIQRIVSDILIMWNVKDICRIGADEFIAFFETREFDEIVLKDIKGVSYGWYCKEAYEDISSAIKKADEEMYKMKNKFHENANKA